MPIYMCVLVNETIYWIFIDLYNFRLDLLKKSTTGNHWGVGVSPALT